MKLPLGFQGHVALKENSGSALWQIRDKIFKKKTSFQRYKSEELSNSGHHKSDYHEEKYVASYYLNQLTVY